MMAGNVSNDSPVFANSIVVREAVTINARQLAAPRRLAARCRDQSVLISTLRNLTVPLSSVTPLPC